MLVVVLYFFMFGNNNQQQQASTFCKRQYLEVGFRCAVDSENIFDIQNEFLLVFRLGKIKLGLDLELFVIKLELFQYLEMSAL